MLSLLGLAIIGLLFSFIHCNYQCPESEQSLLISFYENFNGINWTNKWDLAKPMSQWYGVELNADGHVISLNLPNNNLSGSMTTFNKFCCLEFLKVLNLSSNNVTGIFPTSLPTSLQYLDLSCNHYSSGIPWGSLVNLQYLREFKVKNSHITGIIDGDMLALWSALNIFDMSCNELDLMSYEDLSYAIVTAFRSNDLWSFNVQCNVNLQNSCMTQEDIDYLKSICGKQNISILCGTCPLESCQCSGSSCPLAIYINQCGIYTPRRN